MVPTYTISKLSAKYQFCAIHTADKQAENCSRPDKFYRYTVTDRGRGLAL